MHPAYPPPGLALPAWQIVARLARACDVALPGLRRGSSEGRDGLTGWDHVKQVFAEMTEQVSAFQGHGAAWGREARPIQLRFANSRG
jgi:hypothetical protein